jgi:hypothetical protein
MNFTTGAEPMGSLVGYVSTTRQILTSIFGEPVLYEEGDKITIEWVITFDNGVTATLYDWKRYDEGRPALEEEYKFHIGGDGSDAVILIHKELHRKAGIKREAVSLA